MSGFITELLTLAVYSNFLLLLLEPYEDREAIQTPELLMSYNLCLCKKTAQALFNK